MTADPSKVEALAKAIAEAHGRSAWVLISEDERGELLVLGNVGVESMRLLWKRWERQQREVTRT